MAITSVTKRSPFLKELSKEKSIEYFNLKEKKYLHKIDTLYYSVFISNDNNENEEVNLMCNDILNLKDDLLISGEESLDFCEGLEILRGRHADYYNRLSVRDCFDIYITSHIRNSNTPRILVQLRSSYLWKEGTIKAMEYSFQKVEKLLEKYKLSVDRCQENRIDYAYHTNSIQNPNKFFNPESASKIYKGSLKKFNIIGIFNDDETYSVDYFSLGSPKSNNLFFRIYDKTREVVELNYKGFFFDIWKDEGLINFYDKYCLEYAYVNGGNYEKLYEASLRFYIQYGTNKERKDYFESVLLNPYTTFQDIKKVSISFMPSVTKVLNIEFETKRKYYYYYEDAINALPCNFKYEPLKRVYKIIENRKIFLDMLTYNVVRFEKYEILLDFWRRLRSVKIKSLSEEEIKAKYCNNIDLDKIKVKIINSISSYSVHKGSMGDDISHDLIDFISDLNDNDIKSDNFGAIDLETGEILEVHNPKLKDMYSDKKNKKYKQIKNRLN